MSTTIALQFQGFWRDYCVRSVPRMSGVYVVYAARNNFWNNTVSIRGLIYVGESVAVGDRLTNHERKSDWMRYLLAGEELAYSVALAFPWNRERAEAAIINHHRPPANLEYVGSFPFQQTQVFLSGDCPFLTPVFSASPPLTYARLYDQHARPSPVSPLLDALLRGY